MSDRENRHPVLVLSIHAVHANRIFERTKEFELRKALPRTPFDRVYLYQSGGRGIVGCFDVRTVLREPLNHLWDLVGERATTKERFFSYFDGWKTGCAIEVANPVRFRRALNFKQLKEQSDTFMAPRSYLLVRPNDPIFAVLDDWYADETRQRSVSLRRIKRDEHPQFEELVQRYVGPNYAELDGFARQLINVHKRGEDVHGFLTRKKTIFTVLDEQRKRAGFVVLSSKLGGSIKSGPTLLLDRHRRRGYGQAVRRAIEEHARKAGARKVYCTSPDNARNVIGYLLTAGYRIEAHLERHYSVNHGELVFGKTLSAKESFSLPFHRDNAWSAAVIDAADIAEDTAVAELQRLFTNAWFPVGESFAQSIVRDAARDTDEYAEKPKYLFMLRSGNDYVGAAILLPKRGGALKAMCMSETAHSPSIMRLLDGCEELALRLRRRKLYFLHQAADIEIVKMLRGREFEPEGILRGPYAPGQDVVVLAKLFSSVDDQGQRRVGASWD